jgi:uncharacterized protein (TIRG00374 family)
VSNPRPAGKLKRFLLTAVKYVIALGVLAVVVWRSWDPQDPAAEPALAASTVGLMAPAPGGAGPLTAAAAAYPGRTESKGLRYVWEQHVLKGRVHGEYLALALVICAAGILLTFVRWYILVRALDLPFTVADAVRLGMIGLYFNSLLPGSVGGDILKAAFVAREQSRRTAAVASVIMDRVLGLWALFWLVAVVGGVFYVTGLFPERARQGCGVLILFSAATVVLSAAGWTLLGFLAEPRAEQFAGWLGRLPKVGGSAAEFWRAVRMYRRRQAAVALTLAMSAVGFVGFTLTYYFSVLTLADPGSVPPLSVHFVITPIGLFIGSVPLLPGGIGLSELGFGGLYVAVGFPAAAAVLGSLVQRVNMWALALVGLVVYQRMHLTVKRKAGTLHAAAARAAQPASVDAWRDGSHDSATRPVAP